jgi:hypothetical protein
MKHFKTQNLVILHLICLTSLKSNDIFLILFEILIFSYFLCQFSLSKTFLLCLIYDSLISGCIFSWSKLQILDLLFFYFMFNRFKPPNNPLKPQARTRGNRSSFSGQLGLTFWLCGLDRMTTLSPNPPIPAHYPPLHVTANVLRIVHGENETSAA